MRIDKSFFAITVILLSGCFQASEFHSDAAYTIATRQLPPEPVYNRVYMARPPEVMPARDVQFMNAPRVLPVIHLEVKKADLETVAQILGGSARYRSYCAASLVHRKISIDALGTIDELADTIAKKADIRVSIDHANREVRFLPNRDTVPRLYTEHDKYSQSNN